MPVTMKDIARDLNVSAVTVSKVLRNHSDISLETRERVWKRVKELRYQPNWAARSLVTGRSYTIGLVIPTMTHQFFAEIAKGISGKIRRKGYSLVISSSEEDAELEKMEIEHLLARQVDALIIASVQESAESFHHIQERKVPYVLIDRKFPGLNSNYVGVDDEDIGRLATEHLIQNGSRRIAHIRGPALSTGSGRMIGYRNAIVRHGLEISPKYVVSGRSYDDNAEESGYEAMRKLLSLDPHPDAVFCFNDPIAIGAMKAIWEAGVRIPQDIALIGAGNLHFDELFRVPLSSIDQGSVTIGERAANLALQLIRQRKNPARTQEIVLPAKIVARESSMKTVRSLKTKPATRPKPESR
jgi:LacI family transcriptional regulator, galactose operon repressor